METVSYGGVGLDVSPGPVASIEVGALPYMDDLFIPLSDDCPDKLVARAIEAAQILDRAAAAFSFEIRYGPGQQRLQWSCVVQGGERQWRSSSSANGVQVYTVRQTCPWE